jgi:hypothetical protein
MRPGKEFWRQPMIQVGIKGENAPRQTDHEQEGRDCKASPSMEPDEQCSRHG